LTLKFYWRVYARSWQNSKKYQNHLKALPINGSAELKELFYTLEYRYVNEPLPISKWPDNIKAIIDGVFILSQHAKDFKIIWAKLNASVLKRTEQRPIINQVNRDHPYNLIIFSNQDETLWDFVNVKLVVNEVSDENKEPEKRRIVRRISVRPDEPCRTAVERLSKLEVTDDRSSPLAVQQIHDEAFDVEKVTKEFYKELMEGSNSIFITIVNEIRDFYKELSLAQAFTIRFLSRLMFLHFIQKKGWLGNNFDFINDFWGTYKKEYEGKNKFYSNWLSLLLYKALNNELKKDNIPKYLPQHIIEVLVDAPYLNGGLFTEPKDDKEVKAISPKANNYILKKNEIEVRMVVTTDVLSEGLNLQDCYNLINYDLHWNPVKLIQRFGRIDRIGSEHDEIYGFNFLPETELDKNLNLQEIVHNY